MAPSVAPGVTPGIATGNWGNIEGLDDACKVAIWAAARFSSDRGAGCAPKPDTCAVVVRFASGEVNPRGPLAVAYTLDMAGGFVVAGCRVAIVGIFAAFLGSGRPR